MYNVYYNMEYVLGSGDSTSDTNPFECVKRYDKWWRIDRDGIKHMADYA